MRKLTNYNVFRADIKNHGLEYAAEHSAALGFDAVEFLDLCPCDAPLLPTLGSAEKAKEILDRYHLTVSCYSVGAQLLCKDPTAVETELYSHIAFAAAIGSRFFHHTLVPDLTLAADAPSYDQVLSKIFASAERIASYCEKLGLTCLYEPQGMYFNGVVGLEAFFEKIKSKGHRVGICGDFGNSLFADVAPDMIFDHFIEHIKHVHVKDYLVTDTAIDKKPAFRSRAGKWIYETDLGTGSVKLDSCFQKLKQINYDGAISFEFESDDDTIKAAMRLVRSKLDIL